MSDKAALDAYDNIELRNQEISEGRAAWAEDFSYGGLGIVGDLDLVQDHGLDSKSFLSIELEIPGYWHTLRCVATVAWINRDEAHGCFKAGVSFLNVDKENLHRIHQALEKFAQPARSNLQI